MTYPVSPGHWFLAWNSDILSTNPSAVVSGHLRAMKVHVQRQRIRDTIHRISGRGSPSHPIRRRVYSVPGPNALWHLDGNHKMIRYRLVVHGAIDGFSRMVTFLKCSNNNRASTVLNSFIPARLILTMLFLCNNPPHLFPPIIASK